MPITAAAKDENPPPPPASVELLSRENFSFIWRLLRRLGVAPAHVEDGTQEVFIVAMRRQADIKPGSTRSFLYGVALRIASDMRRRASHRHEVGTADAFAHTATSAPSPEHLLEQRRARAILDQILEAMDTELRAVFVLFELEEMTTAEIAACTGLPMGTVASRLRRARQDFQARVHKLKLQRGLP